MKLKFRSPERGNHPHIMTSNLSTSILKGLKVILQTNKMGQVFNEGTKLQGAYDHIHISLPFSSPPLTSYHHLKQVRGREGNKKLREVK
jgi:hypothetical protein